MAILEVLEHLPRASQQMVIEEIDRVLKKGGILVVTVLTRKRLFIPAVSTVES
ncbi:hypothetical protein TCARB_0688 [Thermofilum adornatum 1505]|uniref:Methyltransferase type 11 domain-containing protein n=1 Tax=Thermofilum adornatum 1505 TaxID=697581 RepID=A0A3G1A8I2_9CREN|nr:hypothetical protein TCARB_0688 [Thermofilum adornatum 1505]